MEMNRQQIWSTAPKTAVKFGRFDYRVRIVAEIVIETGRDEDEVLAAMAKVEQEFRYCNIPSNDDFKFYIVKTLGY
jgi:hypothetical protein